MNSDLLAALKVTGYGLVGVFSTLSLLYFSIFLMRKIMPYDENDKK